MNQRSNPILVLSSIPVFTRNLVWAAGLSNRPCWVMSPYPLDRDCKYGRHVMGVQTVTEEMFVRADDSTLQFVADFCESRAIRIVVAADTRCSRFVQRLAPRLPPSVRCFPICQPELFERLYDKSKFAAILTELSLPGPKTTVIHDIEDLKNTDIEPPALLKPTQGEGGLGIKSATTINELQRFVQAKTDLREHPIIVQSFVPGRDIDLSLLADRGRCVAWTIQVKNDRGDLSFVRRNDLLELGEELVRQIGYHGVLHLDMRIDRRSGEILFIEANPRFWGSLCYSVWAGVNFLDLGIRMLEGEDIATQFRKTEGPCPYLAVTRGSLPRCLLGGWPIPKGLDDAQRKAWKFHHDVGIASSIHGSLKRWFGYDTHRPMAPLPNGLTSRL